MKSMIGVVCGVVLMGVCAAWAAPPVILQQATPGTMSYQGRLQTADGVDYTNGIYTIDFRLYDAASDGALLWGVTYKPYVNHGFFSVILGQTDVGENVISNSLYGVEEFWKGVWIDPNGAQKQRFLGITVHEGADNNPLADPVESFPRQELLASPFAIQAQFAQQAEYANRASGDFQVAGSITSSSGPVKMAGDLAITGGISNPNADLYLSDTVMVTGDLKINAGRKLEIGSCGTLVLPAGEPESGDALIGNDLFVDERVYVGDDILVQDQLVMNYGQPDQHALTHLMAAPMSGLRIVAGRVAHDATEYADLGNQFTVERYTSISSEGAYRVNFTPPFAEAPVVVVCNGTGGNSRDNFVAVESVYPNCVYIVSKDDDPARDATYQDASFHFTAIGR